MISLISRQTKVKSKFFRVKTGCVTRKSEPSQFISLFAYIITKIMGAREQLISVEQARQISSTPNGGRRHTSLGKGLRSLLKKNEK